MVIETPLWLQGGSFSARQDRQILALIFTEGVVDPASGGLLVSERAAGANNSVDVASGQVVITGDDQANQGRYLCRSTATENIALSAAPGADSRIDLIIAQVNDPDAGGAAGDSWTIAVVEGAVAAAPVAPAVPDSAVPLAEVLRTNGDVAVTNAMITDVRPTSATEQFSTLSEFLVVADAAERDALAAGEGDSVWVADIDELHIFDGGSWEKAFPVSAGVELIAEETLAAATTTVTFSSIPATFKHLMVVFVGSHTSTATSRTARMRLNGDSASGSYIGGFGSNGGTFSGSDLPYMNLGSVNKATPAMGRGVIDVPFYAETDFQKAVISRIVQGVAGVTTDFRLSEGAGVWDQAAAINQIELFLESDQWVANSRFALYGIN